MSDDIKKEIIITPEDLAKYDFEGDLAGLESLATSQSIDESLAQAITVLTEEERRKLMSELKNREVFLITMLYAQAQEFHDDLLLSICDNFLITRTSLDRKGRKEIVEIAKANLQKAKNMGLLKKLFGKHNEGI